MSGFEQLFPGQLPRLVMFDLDGTLIDSVPDLAVAVDKMLLKLGRQSAGLEAVREWVGNGAPVLVRRALAITLKNSSVLPRDVALKLARDVDSVALPVLNYSPAVTDEDLAEIVRASDPAKEVAVARRSGFSDTVAGGLVQHGCAEDV